MKKTISKLLMGTITEKELIELRSWLNDPKNQSILEDFIKDYHDLNLAMLKNNVNASYNKVIGKIENKERPVRKLLPIWTKYAAAVVLLIGLAFIYQQGFFVTHEETKIIPKVESITLQLDNGVIQTIDASQMKEVRDANGNIIGTQKQNQISYSQATPINKLIYNTLNVPKGKQFQIKLSDGTLVHLNAGSSLRYPVNFSLSESRHVFLSGEAYFDVTKNIEKPFIVNVGELDVRVLGTEFNISAYMEDMNIEVVLVKGSVDLNKINDVKHSSTVLSPGQMGSFNPDSNNINISQINTSLYTSWMQGELVFRNMTFNNIIAKLERHYNIEIENTNEVLGKEVFNASFDNVKIEEILSFFNDTHKIQYTIENNKIMIK